MPFFSYESKFSQAMLKLCSTAWLNLLWFLCSLPIFTAGASTTALYYVTLKMARDEETNLTKLFFKSFRENFRQATTLWLILLAVGLVLAADGYILYHLRLTATGFPGVLWTLILALIIVVSIVYVIVLLYVFPLVASVSNTNWAMLKNSFFIGIHYLFCSILIFAIHLAMFYVVVNLFTPAIIFGQGLCAFLSSHLLNNVIQACSYEPDAEEAAQ